MAFTAGEIQNVANAALDFYLNKGDVFRQSLQTRPLWDTLERKKKTFPGGKGNISVAVEGKFGDGSGNDVVKGYTHNDTVNFYTPANIMRANYPWREHHLGITLTHTELKIDGISVVDPGSNGERLSNHSNREMTVLVGLLEDKLFDLGESYARGMNALAYGDGVADPKAMAGLGLLIADNPTTGTVGGINRATVGNEWWRNRAYTAAMGTAVTGTPALAKWGGAPITSAPANGGALLQVLQAERRQLIRYGGKPDVFVAGSAFIAAVEVEMRANGLYSQNGFTKTQDGAMGDLQFSGIDIQYDPTLDDLGKAKRAYWFDSKNVFLDAMEDEWLHQHTPARPANQFIMYRSITSTGQIVAKQLNSSLVIDIA
jgi:hypothetical protein